MSISDLWPKMQHCVCPIFISHIPIKRKINRLQCFLTFAFTCQVLSEKKKKSCKSHSVWGKKGSIQLKKKKIASKVVSELMQCYEIIF